MKYYKTKEASELAGVERDRFVQWIFKGLIEPAVESPGRGRAAKFDFDNILTARMISVLYDMGFPLKKAASFAKVLVELGQESQQLDMENPGDPEGSITMVVNIKAYRDQIEERINKM